MRRLYVFVVTLCLLTVAGPANAASQYDITAPGRVVAFGDVHGAYDDWVALLRQVGVVDEQLNWAGGNTHLVSLGDLIDRGPGSRDVVELLKKLDGQAGSQGGAVHLVLGNHEVMVMTGDLRYVSSEEFADFAPDETPADRDAAFAQYKRFNSGADDATLRSAFDTSYPAGFFALRKAYSTTGALGSWLKDKPFVLKVNDKVYMHGGIASTSSEESLDSLNKTLKGDLQGFLASMDTLRAEGVMPWHVSYHDRLQFLNARAEEFAKLNPGQSAPWFRQLKEVFDAQEAFVFSEDSPNWYRGTAMCHPYAESFNTERFLKKVKARHLVMGHTPTRGDVQARMEGLAIRLDTGMLKSVYKGRASALISEGGMQYVQYLGSTERHQPVEEQFSLSQKLSAMPDAEIEDFMRTAEVVSIKDIGTGITKPKRVTQSRDGISNDAVFKYEDTHPGLESKNILFTSSQ